MSEELTKFEDVFPDLFPDLGMDVEAVEQDLRRHYHLTLARDHAVCGESYLFHAVALAVRDRLVERWRRTRERYIEEQPKRVAYLSMEFLMGRALNNAVQNLDMDESLKKALINFGCIFEIVADQERDAGLGNGGLGRLAACFLDSCATLGYPVTGYGIRYDYGIFHQKIREGYQVEVPDHWLEGGSPWEIVDLDATRRVKFGGYTEHYRDNKGHERVRWVSDQDVLAVPHDVPVPGFQNDRVLTLRLWKADSVDEFNLTEFNLGDHNQAFSTQNNAAQISMILYPNDVSMNGKVLRLRQQYFLSSASLQDVIERWTDYHSSFKGFEDKNCFQLNDTHPSVAVAELMRLLLDDYKLGWDDAWSITTKTMAYTNHTLLPEALERWPVQLFKDLLPRLLEIIYEINHRFLEQVKEKWPNDVEKLRAMSIIEEGDEPQVRMAYLAIVGSFSVNGVAALHSELLQQGLFKDFYQLWPEKFNNKTNGVTPRRWLAFCNTGLATLITEKIGDEWVVKLEQLEGLKKYATQKTFQKKWRSIKQANKKLLCKFVKERADVKLDPKMMFDVQVKRIHEYKRQLLNVLHVIHLYARILKGDTKNFTPRAVIIGGKAAPGYATAKLIIKLVNNVASVINNDPKTEGLLRLVFLPNYQVTAMELICPATDLSEQVSTAGKEASGTGNMKFMMNGALTIGTLDGANIEIRDEVGEENFFLFGLTATEVEETRKAYSPEEIISKDKNLSTVMEMLEADLFSVDEPGLFEPLIASVKSKDDLWLTAADFGSFVKAQELAANTYQDQEKWTRMSIMNTACSGFFSSDRTIEEYGRDIWGITD